MNKIAVIGSNHLVAPLSFREQLAFREQLTQANQITIDKNVPISSGIGKAIEAKVEVWGSWVRIVAGIGTGFALAGTV